jgi:NADH-quinone oxidoreductase subunit H
VNDFSPYGLVDGKTMPWDVALIAALIKILVAVGGIMFAVPMAVWFERKLIADIQARVGPSRVGWFGLLQSFADGIKLLTKEAVLPSEVDRLLYFAAPVVVMLPALGVAAVVPFGGDITIFGHTHHLVIADLPMGFLYVLALTSLSVYGVVLAGWSSNNKYSLLGGLRSSAQMVSYELPMGLSIVAGVLLASYVSDQNFMSLSLRQVVDAQAGSMLNWSAFNWRFLFLPGFIAMLTFYIGGLAETNRAPFDLAEAETELVGGYHTEYGGMKFAMFFLGEYAAMLNVSAITTTMFLGGWRAPYKDDFLFPVGSLPFMLQGIFWFVLKVVVIMGVYVWLRGTLPRLRYDRLMSFNWKFMLPLTLLNVFVIAGMLTIFHPAKVPAALLPPTPPPAPAGTSAPVPGGLPEGLPGGLPGGMPGEMPGGLPEQPAPGGMPPGTPGAAPAPSGPAGLEIPGHGPGDGHNHGPDDGHNHGATEAPGLGGLVVPGAAPGAAGTPGSTPPAPPGPATPPATAPAPGGNSR